MEIIPCFYGPYKILQKIGRVAYKLELPSDSRMHHVFHVSNLQRKLGWRNNLQTSLPHITEDGLIQALSDYILDWSFIKRHGKADVEVLVQWQGAGEDS